MKNRLLAIALLIASFGAAGEQQTINFKSTICLRDSFNQLSCGTIGFAEHEAVILGAKSCQNGFEILDKKVRKDQTDGDLYLFASIKCLPPEATPEKPRTE